MSGKWFGPTPPEAPSASVTAEHGVAAGRDIIDSSISIGLDEEKTGQRIAEAQRPMVDQLAGHTEQLTALVAQIGREKGVETAPLRAVLEKLGEIGVPDHEIPTRLNAAADQLTDLRTQLARLSNSRPELAAIRQQALALINEGDLDGARAALSRGREAARDLRQEVSRNEADFLSDEARIDHLQLAYRAAAAKYAEAAALVAPFDHEGEWHFLVQGAGEFYNQGFEFGDNEALIQAIEIYKSARALAPRERLPLNWATTQNHLGNALSSLGKYEVGTIRLKQSIEAFRHALLVFRPDREPLEWAMIQNNLGGALQILSEREGDATRMKDAIEAFRLALSKLSRERLPLRWARTQNNLGTALGSLGERHADAEWLKQSIEAFRHALLVFKPDREPLEWAMTQSNLGNALRNLGECQGGKMHLRKAIKALQLSLLVFTRERMPLEWARIQNILGIALRLLGERTGSVAQVEQAVEAHRCALLEYTEARAPLEWAKITATQGIALVLLAEMCKDVGAAEMAVAQIESGAVTLRKGGHAFASYFEAILPWAHLVRDQLRTSL